MSDEKTNWYRTGTVAKQLGTSAHKVRELARAGLIESQLRNGYRYIPGGEVERLKKEGLPPMPANLEPDSSDADQRADGPPRPIRSRLVQELYADPSPQLARAKEKVIEQELALESKRIQQESRELDRQAKEERRRLREQREEERQATQVQAWRDGYLHDACRKVSAQQWPQVCGEIETLLKGVPPFTDVRSRVQSIVDSVLQAERHRKFQEQLDLLLAISGSVRRWPPRGH